jgi:hypothetical protein
VGALVVFFVGCVFGFVCFGEGLGVGYFVFVCVGSVVVVEVWGVCGGVVICVVVCFDISVCMGWGRLHIGGISQKQGV